MVSLEGRRSSSEIPTKGALPLLGTSAGLIDEPTLSTQTLADSRATENQNEPTSRLISGRFGPPLVRTWGAESLSTKMGAEGL